MSSFSKPSLKGIRCCGGPILVIALLVAVLAAARAGDNEALDQFALAAGHYAQQRWKLAAEQFERFLDQYPDHPQIDQAMFFLAEALLQTGDFEQAGSHFRQYLNRQPDEKYARVALFRAGESAYLAGRSEVAQAELKRFQASYPGDRLNAYVFLYLGDMALEQGEVKEAVRHFRGGLAQFPQGELQDDCRFGLARALERQGQNEEAERLYRAVACPKWPGRSSLAVPAEGGRGRARRPGHEHPLADDAQCHLGVLQYARGRYAQAIETFAAFEGRLADSPWQPNARLGHGWALRKLGRLDEAKSMFAKITSDPKVGVDAWYWLGVVQRTQKDWAAAAESMKAALDAAGPDHELIPDIRFHAGDSLLRAGRPAEAVAQFEQVIASPAAGNQWIDDSLYGKIQAELELKHYGSVDRAAAEFEQRFPQSSLKSDVHRALARSLLQRKKHAEAARRIEPLVALNIADRQGMQDRYLLGLAYQGMKRYEDALAVVLPVLRSAATDVRLKPDAQLLHGSLLLAMGRYSEAIRPLEAFLATEPTGDAAVKGRGELAICYARTNQFEKAKQTFAALREEHPDHKLTAPAAEQLAEAAYEAGQTPWAAELFEWLEDAGGADEYRRKGLAGQAWSELKAGRLEESAETFGKLLEAGPPAEMAAEAALVRGQILQRLGRSDPALAMYDLVIDNYRNSKQHPKALLAAARLRDALQQDRESIVLYRRLAEEYPERDDIDAVLYEWAWVLDELGRTDASTELFERLRKEHPESAYRADATYRLAQRAYATADYARATELTRKVLAGKPSPSLREYALDLRGHIAVAQNDWEHARKAFSALITEFPESPRRLVAEFYIAEAAYMQKDFKQAVRRFDRLGRQTRSNRREAWLAAAALRHAQALAQLKRWNEAFKIASKIAAEFPQFKQQYEADYLIGRCLAAGADFQGARDAYLRVIRSPAGAKTETAAMAQLMIAETFFHQNDYAAALREYLRLEILYAYPTWQALALLQAGKCHEKLREWKQAADLYARVLKVYPRSDSAEEAARRLRTPPDQNQPRRDHFDTPD